MRAVAPDDGCYRSFSLLVYEIVLLAVLFAVTESQVFADRIVGAVDFLAATAGLQIDFYADFINGLTLQLQTDNLSETRVLLIKVRQKLDLQFFFGGFRAKLIDDLILNRGLGCVFDVKGLTVIFIVQGQDLHAVRIVAFMESLFRTSLAASGEGAKFV